MNKYRAKKTVVDGITFDSKREALRYGELKLLEKAKVIRDLEVHPKFKLVRYPIEIKYSNGRIAVYTADFSYITNAGDVVIEDVKGVVTSEAKFRIAVFESLYKLPVNIVK